MKVPYCIFKIIEFQNEYFCEKKNLQYSRLEIFDKNGNSQVHQICIK